MDITIRLTQDQTDYIQLYLGHPIIPVKKDLEIVTSIKDQIASAVQQAILANSMKQEAHKQLDKIARIIIAKRDTGKEAFDKQEWDNILRRVIDVDIAYRKREQEYYRILFRNDRQPYYIAKFSSYVDAWEIWEYQEAQTLPWFACPEPEPFLVVTEDALSYFEGER